ncbi:copper homeostasis protein cutC [Curvularia clavata]|uniref:Copper homeostasis protein cutC homolog n=1 Tax=Curvularia clavata TaxID=95742 RepID=A0A9Q9DW52_CURCL|nr:copper homeostasis protein cutC [Curvularia clavata]
MLEIACFNASSAIASAQAGADRIELCSDYAAGGVTPSLSTLEDVRSQTTSAVNVMIRPRAGDFNYTAEEFARMEAEVVSLKPFASGFVFGILDPNHRVDEARNHRLVQLAAPLPCTFHRAIDETDDLDEAVEAVVRCGFKNILTSGSAGNALQGAERLHQLQMKFGHCISLIAGGGARNGNIGEIKRKTGVPWLHSAAITLPGENVDVTEVRKMKDSLVEIERS